MRIRNIIRHSLELPFREYKMFLVVVFLACICELNSEVFYSINLGKLSIVMMAINSIVSMIIIGIMLSLTYNAVNQSRFEYWDFVEHFIEGFKEYIITMYYMFLTVLLSSLFIVPTGVYAKLLHIHEYILKMDINTTFLTFHDLSAQLPVSLQINLANSIQLNVLISIFIFVFLLSFSFIGKIILNKSSNLKKALNPKLIHKYIKNIGYKRYVKFVLIISFIMILLCNILWYLEYFFSDVIISSILEAFILFFSTDSFYLIMTSNGK